MLPRSSPRWDRVAEDVSYRETETWWTMKLKKSSGSKVAEASEEIADQLDTDTSNVRIAGMVLGAVVALGAIVYAVATFMPFEED